MRTEALPRRFLGLVPCILAALGCATTPSTTAAPGTQVTAESVERELIQSLQASANEIHEIKATLEDPSQTSQHKAAALTKLLDTAQSLLDGKTIIQGCAKWVRYQEYGRGASYAKRECEEHYDVERWSQMHDALTLLTWHPNNEATAFAKAVVHDIRTKTAVRAAAISMLDALAARDPALAAEAATARSELAARERFYVDNAGTLADLSDNLRLCFNGRDRDMDVIFEVNTYGEVSRIHSPLPNSATERCVVKFTLAEEFRMQTTRNLVFRIHVVYRSNM